MLCGSWGGVFEVIKKELDKKNIFNIVSDNYLDFYLESISIMVREDIDKIINNIISGIELFDDNESIMIYWRHLQDYFLTSEHCLNFNWTDMAIPNQYFTNECVGIEKDEIIIECGSFIGDSIKELLEIMKRDDFKLYYCFEMNKNNFKKLESYLYNQSPQIQKKFICINKGVADNNRYIGYINSSITSALTEGKCDEHVEIVALDTINEVSNCSFIKMDIEGSEKAAIKGAKRLISNNKPKCAICTYHYVADLWEIPLLLQSIVPEYNFLLRHHSNGWSETVCYASIFSE